MADSAAQVAGIAARLRAQGFTVVEVPGWESRGKGPMTTRGRIEHHTAGPRTGDTPTLRVVTFGHAALRNSLCRWYVSRSGVIYLVALGLSWHAGVGIKGSNQSLSGTEAEHSGRADELWTARSLEAQAAITREELRTFGCPPDAVWEHKEHAPARKVDRVHIDGDAWRRRLTTTPQEDDTVTEADKDDIAKKVVELLLTGTELNDPHTGNQLDVQTFLRQGSGRLRAMEARYDNHFKRIRDSIAALGAKVGVTVDPSKGTPRKDITS